MLEAKTTKARVAFGPTFSIDEASALDAFAHSHGFDRTKLVRAALEAYTGIKLNSARFRSLARDGDIKLELSPAQESAARGMGALLDPAFLDKHAKQLGANSARDFLANLRD